MFVRWSKPVAKNSSSFTATPDVFFGAVMCSVLRHLDSGVIYNSYEFLQHNSWQNTSGELISVFVELNTQHQTRISELKKGQTATKHQQQTAKCSV